MGRIELEKPLNGAITADAFPTRLLINRRNRMEFGVVTPFNVQIHSECARTLYVCVRHYIFSMLRRNYNQVCKITNTHTARASLEHQRTIVPAKHEQLVTTTLSIHFILFQRIPKFTTYVCVLHVCDTLCMCIGPVRNPYSRYFILQVLCCHYFFYFFAFVLYHPLPCLVPHIPLFSQICTFAHSWLSSCRFRFGISIVTIINCFF